MAVIGDANSTEAGDCFCYLGEVGIEFFRLAGEEYCEDTSCCCQSFSRSTRISARY